MSNVDIIRNKDPGHLWKRPSEKRIKSDSKFCQPANEYFQPVIAEKITSLCPHFSLDMMPGANSTGELPGFGAIGQVKLFNSKGYVAMDEDFE